MIAKFDSKARSGTGIELKAYLENGTNNDRNTKDKRVALFGDINILCSAIKLGHNKGYKETYRNLVISFDEDEVALDDLQNIALEYIKQYTYGYEDDEIVAYAETHIPKVKYKMKFNKITKEFEKVKRKPHIHISFAMYSSKLDKKLILNSNDKRIYDINLLTRKLELQYDFTPVRQKAIANDVTQVQPTSKKLHSRKTIKDSIDEYIYKNIDLIGSFEELKRKLEKELQIKIVRESKTNAKIKSITIVYNNKKIRLKGDIFHNSTFESAKNEILNKTIKNDAPKLDIEAINKELDEFNQKKSKYIEKNNSYARQKAQKRIDEYFYPTKTQKNIFYSYQVKIYNSIYGKDIDYDLQGFYIKKFDNNPIPITVLSHQDKKIKVVDRGDEVTIEGKNLKEEVKLSIEICLAKGWELEDIQSDGGDEFINESKKQIEKLIKMRDEKIEKFTKKSEVINSKIINNANFNEKNDVNDVIKKEILKKNPKRSFYKSNIN